MDLEDMEDSSEDRALRRFVGVLFAALAILATTIITCTMFFNSVLPRIEIDLNSGTVSGIVTMLQPQNHNTYVYEYSVAGKAYTGYGLICHRYCPHVGMVIAVRYDRSRPEQSTVGDSATAWRPNLIFAVAIWAGGWVYALTTLFRLRLWPFHRLQG
jgi:hypothetical protein